MATMTEFLAMELVDTCSPGKKVSSDLCNSCWISNCTNSWVYKQERIFWAWYEEQQKVAALVRKLKKPGVIAGTSERPGFRYCSN